MKNNIYSKVKIGIKVLDVIIIGGLISLVLLVLFLAFWAKR